MTTKLRVAIIIIGVQHGCVSMKYCILFILYILCTLQRDSSSPGGDSQSSGDGYTAGTDRARADSQSSSEGVHSDSSADRPRTDSQSSREERSSVSPNGWVNNSAKE